MLIFAVIFVFAIKYRRNRAMRVPQPIHGSLRLEITWSIIPFLVMLTLLLVGRARSTSPNAAPPPNAMDIYVVGKQWMWKIQYPGGQREINELHVPVGRPVKITLASEDVIHSFFIPAFRIKHDVVPGHYDTMWFTANQAGPLSLFLRRVLRHRALRHGRLGHRDEPSRLSRTGWPAAEPKAPWRSRASSCSSSWVAPPAICWTGRAAARTCAESTDRASSSPTAAPCVADDAYIRESILNPNAKIVAGLPADVMPSSRARSAKKELLQLIVYIKSLAITSAPGAPAARIGTAPQRPRPPQAQRATARETAGGKQ